ncbi:MAG: hypothetical protein U0794_20740 [Isosphaeraceae bacterium]
MRRPFLRWPARLPFGLIGMIALVLPIEYGIQRSGELFMTPHERDWKAAGRLARSPVSRAEILCFGDSMLKFGIAPPILQKQLGRSTYCLALLDGKPPASYFLLRRALESGSRPRVVLVDYQPECMFQPRESLAINRHWKAMLDPRETFDYAWNYRDFDFFGRIMLSRFLPSYCCRTEIRSNTLLAIAGQESPNPLDNRKVGRNRRLNQGGLLLAPQPTFRGEVNPAFAESLYQADWFHRPENTVYVRRFMALAQEHGIPVVWVVPPNAPEVEQTREKIGLRARYDRFVEAVMQRYSNVYVLDARQSGYPARVFVDPVHLDRNGATVLSLAIADALQAIVADRQSTSPSGKRWIALAPFQSAPTALVLEDMEQSRAHLIALERTKAVRR